MIKGPIPEVTFWNKDISFVRGLLFNDIAYEEWLSYQIEKEKKQHG